MYFPAFRQCILMILLFSCFRSQDSSRPALCSEAFVILAHLRFLFSTLARKQVCEAEGSGCRACSALPSVAALGGCLITSKPDRDLGDSRTKS